MYLKGKDLPECIKNTQSVQEDKIYEIEYEGEDDSIQEFKVVKFIETKSFNELKKEMYLNGPNINWGHFKDLDEIKI